LQNKELIECITREVLKKLEQNDLSSVAKKKLLLTDDIDHNFSENIKTKYELCLFDKLEEKNNLTEFENLVITSLDTKLLLAVSELIQISLEAELILKFLLQGKNVYVITEGVNYYQYQRTSPKTLYNKIMEAENKLKSFGIEFLTSAELEMRLIENNNDISLEKEEHIVNYDSEYFLLEKKLVDYSTIKNLYERNHSKIEVPAKSILTALAEDFIKEKNIKLKLIEGR